MTTALDIAKEVVYNNRRYGLPKGGFPSLILIKQTCNAFI